MKTNQPSSQPTLITFWVLQQTYLNGGFQYHHLFVEAESSAQAQAHAMTTVSGDDYAEIISCNVADEILDNIKALKSHIDSKAALSKACFFILIYDRVTNSSAGVINVNRNIRKACLSALGTVIKESGQNAPIDYTRYSVKWVCDILSLDALTQELQTGLNASQHLN